MLKRSSLSHRLSPSLRPYPLALLIALIGGSAVSAQAADAIIPNAGTLLQQVPPIAPPSVPSGSTGLRLQVPDAGALPASLSIRIDRIEITGNSKVNTQTLHALVADAQGQTMDLRQMGELARRITDYYRAHGYPLARAIIPAQTMQAGILKIEVIEARYGKIDIDNQSRVHDRLLQATISDLQSGDVIAQDQMNRSLLLLADIPGLVVNATVKAGAQAGTSDLHVDATSAPMFSGSVIADNGGDSYTGRVRMGATANAFGLAGQGDVLGATVLSSGDGMRYGRVSYDALINGSGTRVGGAYSALNYKLLGALSALGGKGSATVASLSVRQPLIRGMQANLNGQVDYSHLQLNDDIANFGLQTHRHLDNVTATLSGNVRDGFLAGGVSLVNASATRGQVSFDNAAAGISDAATAKTQGGFSKGNLTLLRLQNLTAQDAVFISFGAQWSSGNLDGSQKLVVGGANSVRAYDVGSVSGDTGYTLTAELRHTFAQPWYGQWQAIAFFDTAHVEVNRVTFSTDANGASLSGAGAGLNWLGPRQISINLVVATPVGALPRQIASRTSARAWLQASVGF